MENPHNILEKFGARWPIDKVKKITLEEYALGNDNYKDTFSYWVETETKDLGDISGIGGGGSFKHGIYFMTNKKEFSGNKRMNNKNFAWLKKYGNTADDAFLRIKSMLIEVISAAQVYDWKRIDQVDFYAPVKWKWAFLYSNNQLFPVYKKEALEIAAQKLGFSKKDISYPSLYDFLYRQKTEDQDSFQFGDKIWEVYQENKPFNYYILGSKYGEYAEKDVFQDMYKRKVISTGFASEIDLGEFVGSPQREITDYLKGKGEVLKSYSCLKYFLNIKPGDKIAIKSDGSPKGSKGFLSIVGIAEVIEAEEYYVHDPRDLGHTLPVKWILAPVYQEFENGGYARTIHKLTDTALIDKIFNNNYSVLPEKESYGYVNNMQMKPLNQILYGPPGTGKTYNTINKALEICGIDVSKIEKRDKLKEEFDKLMDDGRIVFTTFHQSLSYEDFVEGIKPIAPEKEGDQMIYKVEDGIFQKICIDAAFSIAKSGDSEMKETLLDFSLAFDAFVESENEKLAAGNHARLETKTGGFIDIESISENGTITIKHPGGTRPYIVTKQRLSRLNAGIENLDNVENINDEFRAIIGGCNSTAFWAVLNKVLQKSREGKNIASKEKAYLLEDKKMVVQSMKPMDYKNNVGEPYVLIIDEINRGNVSQIFGELITLIEDDKRQGKEESLQVVLPYSKEKFGIPPNLYIIGTMNTADRSVEALDTALRRRFSFIEIAPNPGILENKREDKGIFEGINLINLMTTINNRIEKLVDKDHMIGHSYFLLIKNVEALKQVFQNKIIPLLQEYFYGDYGKIGLVIGSGFFIKQEQKNDSHLFAPFEDYEINQLLEKKVYQLKDVTNMTDEEFKNALSILF